MTNNPPDAAKKLMLLSLKIALRYLRAPKASSGSNAIAIVSVAGVAVATAALVCVLSVFNGFHRVLTERLDTLTPDVEITARRGKTIQSVDSLVEVVRAIEGVETATPTISDQALAICRSREMPVRLKGIIPGEYAGIAKLDSVTIAGEPKVDEDNIIAAIGAVLRLGQPMAGDSMLLFAPQRYGRVNMANPANSFITDSLRIAGVFETKQSSFDQDMLIVDIATARELLEYDDEATAIEVKASRGVAPETLAHVVTQHLGDKYQVKDRLRQQEVNFKMVEIEKWITFLLLFFILIIASFNIISTMTMFVVDKRRQIAILRNLGMTGRGIGGVFAWQSLAVTFTGGISGMIIGLILCLLQERYGFIHLSGDPGQLTMAAYPVEVQWMDFAIISIPIILIGGVTAFIAARYARRHL